MSNENKQNAGVRVCAISDAECSRGCGAGACKKEDADPLSDAGQHALYARSPAEPQPDDHAACAHDYVRTDSVCTECGERATQQATKGDGRPSFLEKKTYDASSNTERPSQESYDEGYVEGWNDAIDATPHPVAGSAGQATPPTPQQISDYLHMLDEIQREVVECEARAMPRAVPNEGSAGQAPVGVVVAADPVHGWHMRPLCDWATIGEGTYLYTAPSLTTDAGAVLTDEQRESLENAIANFDRNRFIADAANLRALLAAHPEQRMSDAAPTFEGKHVSLKQHGAKLVLTLELDAIEGAPRYTVTPLNPAAVRNAAHDPNDRTIAFLRDQNRRIIETSDRVHAESDRYRWLRRQAVATHHRDELICQWEVDYVLRGESFDEAIDAARKAEIERQGGEA